MRFLPRALAPLLAVGWALLVADPCAAQTVYKLIDRNGKVTYTQEAPKDFDGKVIRIDIDPNANRATLLPPGERAGKEAAPPAPAAKAAPSREQQLEQARTRLEAARKALGDAREHPGEGDFRFLGKVGGGSRRVPTEAYQRRLADLERQVKEAQDDLEKLEAQR